MVIIVGAGLSGLLTAFRLKQSGVAFKILEARDRIGGRIYTAEGKNGAGLEMGATWFGQQHRELIALLNELKISSFEQYMTGTAFFQPFSTSPASSIQIPAQPPSYRITGGTHALINALYKELDKGDVLLNQQVTKIVKDDDGVWVEAKEKFKANKVIITLPPKLWEHLISFEPALPNELTEVARATQTWMEDSIKVAIEYKTPFWRAKHQSGTLFSNTGPIAEFYDHSNAEASKFALCGFINSNFKLLSFEERQERILQQLQSTFGDDVQSYVDYRECIWSEEKNSNSPNAIPLFPHQNNGHALFQKGYYNNQLHFAGTEVSPSFGGYMEGAICSVIELLKKLNINA